MYDLGKSLKKAKESSEKASGKDASDKPLSASNEGDNSNDDTLYAFYKEEKENYNRSKANASLWVKSYQTYKEDLESGDSISSYIKSGKDKSRAKYTSIEKYTEDVTFMTEHHTTGLELLTEWHYTSYKCAQGMLSIQRGVMRKAQLEEYRQLEKLASSVIDTLDMENLQSFYSDQDAQASLEIKLKDLNAYIKSQDRQLRKFQRRKKELENQQELLTTPEERSSAVADLTI